MPFDKNTIIWVTFILAGAMRQSEGGKLNLSRQRHYGCNISLEWFG